MWLVNSWIYISITWIRLEHSDPEYTHNVMNNPELWKIQNEPESLCFIKYVWKVVLVLSILETYMDHLTLLRF